MKKVTICFLLAIALISCSRNNTVKIVDRYYIDHLGDNVTDWLFFGTIEDGGEGIIGGVESSVEWNQ